MDPKGLPLCLIATPAPAIAGKVGNRAVAFRSQHQLAAALA
jgi:hypothetical protein